jgi:hypothetical protein
MSANDVAIVGIGMHPFGRTDGVSGRQQGAVATRAALADAGISWSDVQFAFGGSDAAGNADALVADLGLTGVEFVNVSNGCATGGSSSRRPGSSTSFCVRISFCRTCWDRSRRFWERVRSISALETAGWAWSTRVTSRMPLLLRPQRTCTTERRWS